MATAAMTATIASSQEIGGERNIRPASLSLWRIATAAAGPRNANVSKANAMPVASMSYVIRR